MDELTTPERQRDSGTGANDGYTDLEMIEKDNKTLRERVAELEAQLEQRETFYKSEMQRERDNYNAAIKNANNIIAQLKEYERGAWNEAIEAAAQFCNNNAIAFDNGNSYLSPVDHELLEEMSGKNFKHGGTYYADAIRELKK